jgi:hypothetical protein
LDALHEASRGGGDNPRHGETSLIGEFTDKTRHAFELTGEGDWVLVLDATPEK